MSGGALERRLNVVFLGKSGAGKSTLSSQLGEKYSMRVIATGDYLKHERTQNTLLGNYISNFWKVETLRDIGLEYIQEELEASKTKDQSFIICAPRTVTEAQTRDEIHQRLDLPIDAVVELQLSDEVCLERLKARYVAGDFEDHPLGSEQSVLDDQSLDQIDAKIYFHYEHLDEIRTYYQSQSHISYVNFDASDSVENNFKKLCEIFESLAQQPRKTPEYPKLPPQVDPELPEAHPEFFENIVGRKRGELIQLMVNLGGAERPGYPVTLPVSLGAENLSELLNRNYKLVRKLDGDRRLVLIRNNSLYLINRKLVVERDRTLWLADKWNDTLLDAELIYSSKIHPGRPTLFLLDGLCINGKDIKSRTLEDRVNFLDIFKKQIRVLSEVLAGAAEVPQTEKSNPSENSENSENSEKEISDPSTNEKVLDVTIQMYHALPRVVDLIKMGEKLPYDPTATSRLHPSFYESADGLIFVPTHSRYNIGRSSYLLKWKPDVYNTIDFAMFREEHPVESSPPGSEASGAKEIRIALKSLDKYNNFVTHGYLLATDQINDVSDGAIIECRRKVSPDTKEATWVFTRVRTDRTHPNSTWLVENNIQTFDNPVSVPELVATCKRAHENSQQHAKKHSSHNSSHSGSRGKPNRGGKNFKSRN